MRILSIRQVEDGKAGKAMSLVAAADYVLTFREGKEPSEDWKNKILEFTEQPSILINLSAIWILCGTSRKL